MKQLIAMAVFFMACGGMPRAGENLPESVRAYHEGIRWARYFRAAERIPERERSEFLDEWDALAKELHITDYEVIDVVGPKGDHAKVIVKYIWYRNDERIVRETQAEQAWERRGKDWFLVGEVRLRGEQMPGVPDGQASSEPASVL